MRVYFHEIHVSWSELLFIPIYFHCCKLIELWIGYDGLGLFKRQETEVDVTLGTIFPIYFRCQTQIEPRIGRDAFRYFDLLSTVFSLKYEVSPFICIFRVAYMGSKQTWLLAKVYCQFEAKFRTLMIEEILSAAKFRFEAKIQRKSALCSNEMSLKRPRTFDRIFARTFDERSSEQITKFVEFRLHYFCTILYIDLFIYLLLYLYAPPS